MNIDPIKKIVIVGGGIVGWTAAAILARGLKSEDIKITLIEVPDLPADDIAESSMPSLRPLHQMLGFDERQLMSVTGASFKLGTEYHRVDGSPFIHPLGHPATTIPALEQEAIKLHHVGDHAPYEDFFLAAVAARQGKCVLPGQDKSIFSTVSCGLHLDLKTYAKYLQDYAGYLQVAALKATIQGLDVCGESGFIKALVLDDSSKVEADLFIDCSGENALLIGHSSLAKEYSSWSAELPLDRVVNFTVPYTSAKPDKIYPLTKVHAKAWGWHRAIPLQNKTVHQFIYQSDFLDDGGLRREINRLTAEQDTPYTSRDVKPGCRKTRWSRNCVAVGAAAGSVTSLAVSELHAAQSALVRLLDYFPNKFCLPFNTAEYNRLCLNEFERMRDYHVAHQLILNSKSVSASQFDKVSAPATLQHRIDLFRHRGRIASYEYDVISEQLWTAFFLGAGLWPQGCDIMTETLSEQELSQKHRRIRMAIRNAADAMPSHHELLSRYCPAR